MGSMFLKWGPVPVTLALMIIIAAATFTSAQNQNQNQNQRPTGTSGDPKKSNSKDSGSSGGSRLSLEKVLAQVSPYQNSTKLFSERFGKAPRDSQAFHYPDLPQVYWSKHKRPYVPLLDPEIYGDFNDNRDSA